MRTAMSVVGVGLTLGILSAAPPAGAQAGAARQAGQSVSAAPATNSAQAAPSEAATGGTAASRPSSWASGSSARYLAANCANCHGTDGHSVGAVVSLAGYPAERLVEQMNAFRDGSRPATIMHQLAKGYSDAQIAVLATYFAAQTPTVPADAGQSGAAQTQSGAAR
jgi:sulfide dehydrogenase cytochrome subunit